MHQVFRLFLMANNRMFSQASLFPDLLFWQESEVKIFMSDLTHHFLVVWIECLFDEREIVSAELLLDGD